jgi:glutathione peroxidase
MEDRDIYDFELRASDGSAFPLRGLEGKALLIVNTASKCGFTPQYKGLEALHRRYRDRGLVVIGAPCDQFAHQEPGSDAEIKSFCEINYGVSFPIMAKVEVNGPGAHPLFVELRRRTRGLLGDRVKWNFTKFLVSPGGGRVKRFEPTVEPESMAAEIEKELPGPSR